MNDRARTEPEAGQVQAPHESLRGARIMLVAAGVPEMQPLEVTLRTAGAIVDRVHPRDNWRWLFFERQPQMLIAFVTADEADGGLTADALLDSDLTAHALVLALILPGATAPPAGVSASVPATARAELVAARAAQLLSPDQPAITLRVGAVALDAHGSGAWVAGQPVRLTPTEYALLAYLLTNRSRVLPYERIMSDVWPAGGAPSVRALAVHFTRLRTKLAGAPGVRLSVMRGVGYCLDLPASV